jgi:hypothetical protein
VAGISIPTSSASVLKTVKIIHTVVWALFASGILAIWVFAWRAEFSYAVLLVGVVCVEVLVLSLNGWRCPLALVAARYTHDRRDNFDIYLPEWLARHNKLIFGALYLAGILFTLTRWVYASP